MPLGLSKESIERRRRAFPSLAYSFAKLHMPEPNSGCWLWIGKINKQGYGVLSRYPGGKQKTLRAHIVGYEMYVGKVPAGLELDHKCRVRSCVNPNHLEPVTHAENVRRGLAGAAMRQKTHCIRGHDLAVHARVNGAGHRICRACHRARYAEGRYA